MHNCVHCWGELWPQGAYRYKTKGEKMNLNNTDFECMKHIKIRNIRCPTLDILAYGSSTFWGPDC